MLNYQRVQYNFQSWRNWGLHPSCQVFGQSRRSRCALWLHTLHCSGGLRAGVSPWLSIWHSVLLFLVWQTAKQQSKWFLWQKCGFSWVSIWLCVSASLFFLLKTIFLLLCYSFESLLFCFRCFLLSLPFPFFMLFHRFAAFFLPRFPAAWPLCFHLLILSSLTFMLSCFPAFVP